jgi:hypothetical protein
MPSLNGLVDIKADSINSTTIESDEVNSKNIDTKTLFVDGLNLGEQVNINAQKLTAITYTETPSPLTTISSDVSINNALLNLTGEFNISNRNNTTQNLKINYEDSLNGFCFTQTPGGYMNFRIRKSDGTFSLFYFSEGQLYASMPVYVNNTITCAHNQNLILGDSNTTTWNGSRMRFVPNSNPWDGLTFYSRGFDNNTAYHINFTANDLSNIETAILRMNYNNIWSKVKHTFENSLIGQDASFNSTLSVGGPSTLNAINGNSLNIVNTTTLNTTILNGNFSCVGPSTFTSNALFNGIVSLASNFTVKGTTNTKSITCTTLYVSGVSTLYGASTMGSVTADSLLVYNITNLNGKLIGQDASFNTTLSVGGISSLNAINGTSLNITGSLIGQDASFNSTMSIGGTLTTNGAMTVRNTISTNNNFTMTGTTANTNKITQTRVVGDIAGNPNIFKYSEFNYNNSGVSTPQPCIVCREETSSNSMYFFPKLGQGSYNNIVQDSDRGIFSFFPQNSNAITLTAWASTRVGVRVASTSATATLVDIWAKDYNLKVDSSLGIIATGSVFSSSIPDFNILNGGRSRGLNFISNSVSSSSNPFVVASEAVITTATQNNSSLVLTTNNSALNMGLRLSSSSTTVGNIKLQVLTNSLVMNQTNTTISGPFVVSGSCQLNGTTSSTNKIIQNIVADEFTGNPNVFKYSTIHQAVIGSTIAPNLVCNYYDISSNSYSTINFYNKLFATNYNPSIKDNDTAIISGGILDKNAIVISNHGTIKSGLRISTTASTNSQVGLYCANSSIVMNKSSIESIDINTEIITDTATSGYYLTSAETYLVTTNDLYPCKYRALTHEFSKQTGSDGCTVNIKGNLTLPVASTGITFSSGQIQTNAFNSNTCGYTKSGSTITYPSGTIIQYGDSTQQSTAYTTLDNTKLQAIGTIVSGVMSATTTLTTGVGFKAAALDLTVGTWIISVNSCIAVITGTTTVGSILAGYSTSPTSLSQSYNLAINHLNGATSSASTQWILATSNPVVVTTNTTYYMLTSCNFGTASRIQFVSSNSDFKAIRIA